MSSQAHRFPRRDSSPSSSPSSTHESDSSPAIPAANIMDRRSAAWQSTPTLVNDLDGANSSGDVGRGNTVGYPPRHHSHGAIASHFLAQPAEAYGGQTWVDFLRESGVENTTPHGRNNEQPNALHARATSSSVGPFAMSNRYTRSSEASSTASTTSSERKRRLTATESPMRRTSLTRHRYGNPGSSSADPMVLASSPPLPPAPRPPLPSHPSRSSFVTSPRRESDIVLPPWQPDSEVTHCPVCGSQFTFFYRKHHCRKCGRVVCSACSPHRITIPRQFIVHPPSDVLAGISIMDLTRDENDDSNATSPDLTNNPALGGGEEVRVCNPCVPDPNYAPPPQYLDPLSIGPFTVSTGARDPRHSPYSPPGFGGPMDLNGPWPASRGGPSFGQPTSNINTPMFNPFTAPGYGRPDSQYQHGLSPYVMPPPSRPPPDDNNHRRSTAHRPPRMFSDRFEEARRDVRARSSTTSHASLHSRSSTAPPIPPMPQPQPQPRRQIAEEDECPICGNELPPKGPDNDSTARDKHVMDCIALYSSSPPPPTAAVPSTSLPAQSSMMAGSGVGTPVAGSSSNRLSLNARGLFPYMATEKDCVDDEGKEAECIICFEEFEEGDRLARLACWCRFHEKCIRQWWEHKGRGACPTHQQGL